MNLLITNTRNSQAYSVIRALRPHAKKIVVTMFGRNRLAARLSHAANSRLVDRRYYVPSAAQDWKAGRIQKENTDNEERYIRAVLKICENENIDTIFPSFDPDVYVFSKNKARFEKLGILIPVPDYDVVVIPLDEYRTVLAAQETGFPCPKTRKANHLNVLNVWNQIYFDSSNCLTRFTTAGSISYNPFTIFSIPAPSTGLISSFAFSASAIN